MTDSLKIALPGSERSILPGARLVGPTDPNQLVEVSIVVKQRRPLKLEDLQGKALSHDEFAAAYGAEPEQIQRVHDFAEANGLEVLEQPDEVARRTVKVRGTVANLEKAFSVTLHDYEHPTCNYRGRTGSIHLPVEMTDIVQGVFGLDNRVQAKPHFRFRTDSTAQGAVAAAANVSYTPVQIAKLYNFPAGVDGTGQSIGIIELGGGYNQSDITSYFRSLNLTPPSVTSVSVDKGVNSPTTANSADAEVLLDIEVAGAVAPGAKIFVYFAPNTSQGFQDALSTAIHDSVNNPSVVSISWGGPESSWTQQLIQSMDQVAQEAAALGVTITAAAGDNGSDDGVGDGANHVDFPASSPHVLACGGTSLQSSGGSISSETVWNDGSQGGATGGGFSANFSQPSFQSGIAGQTMRGVPDVAGNADPNTGYSVLVDGTQSVIGGTSAVAPLWAGLLALLNQKLNTRLGYIHASLYSLPETSAFNDITQGNNGAYSAGPGWDATTGLGSPKGASLAGLLASPPAAAPPANGGGAAGGATAGAGNGSMSPTPVN